MPEYQEAKKTDKTKQKETLKVSKCQKESHDKDAILCPNCHASIPDEAIFCPECGYNISQPLFCPNCGAKTNPGADICPVCKSWLLEGKCKFCYAEIPVDADFCPECGNPKDGIICPKCGKLSIFDFCPECGIPLSDGALAALKQVKNDPEAKALVEVIQKSYDIEAELSKLENFLNNEQKIETTTPLVKKTFFSDERMAAILKTDQNRDANAQRRIEAEKKKKEVEKQRYEQEQLKKIREAKERKEMLEKQKVAAVAALNEAARKFASKKFFSHQDARRWYSANRHPNAVGWLCNFSNTVHLYPAGANDCDEPGLGGCDYFGNVIFVDRKGPA